MGATILRGLAYAALASLILVASCDAAIERDLAPSLLPAAVLVE